jgi:hypothetical protein
VTGQIGQIANSGQTDFRGCCGEGCLWYCQPSSDTRDNDRVLADVTGTVVAGWGTNADPARVTRALALLPRLHALGVTKDGHPRHPLYVRADAPLIEWMP